jgi:hypothetical protein
VKLTLQELTAVQQDAAFDKGSISDSAALQRRDKAEARKACPGKDLFARLYQKRIKPLLCLGGQCQNWIYTNGRTSWSMYVILPFIFTAARQDDRRPPPYTTKFRNYEAKLSLGNSIASYLSLNEAYMQYENLTQDEIWAAIQYLDPDDTW